mgnify:FL=1
MMLPQQYQNRLQPQGQGGGTGPGGSIYTRGILGERGGGTGQEPRPSDWGLDNRAPQLPGQGQYDPADLAPSDSTKPIRTSWGAGCPSPKEHIQLANNDWILAGNLKVGDEVITSEDPQKVTRVERLENSPRCEVSFEDSDSIVTSYSHPYFVNSKGFVEVSNLEK